MVNSPSFFSKIATKFSVSFFVMTLLFSMKAVAQQTTADLRPLTFASPNVAAINKYGSIPVGLYNGTIDVTIPIYNLKEGDIVVPVNLAYNSSGIRVEDKASWAGLGWSLTCTNVVSREVRGFEDEKTGGYITDGRIALATLLSGMSIPGPDLYKHIGSQDLTAQKRTLLNDLCPAGLGGHVRDNEPDIYNYSTSSTSGKYFFTDGGQIAYMPFNNTKVEFPNVAGNSWTITDGSGVKYRFGNKVEWIQGDDGFIRTNTWFLEEITDSKNNSVKFYYTGYGYQAWERKYDHFDPNIQTKWLSNYTNTYKLDSIVSGSEKVIFYAEKNRIDVKGEFKLDSITVVNKAGVVVRRASLAKSYKIGIDSGPTWFGDADTHKRLNLDQVIIDKVQKYTLEYNAGLLPSRLSRSQDLWGYHNGANNATLVPNFFRTYDPIYYGLPSSYSGYFSVPAGDRTPSPTHMAAQVLEKITYPTGGSSEFQYEANEVWEKLYGGVPAMVKYKDSTYTKTYGINVNQTAIKTPLKVRFGTLKTDISIWAINGSSVTNSTVEILLVDKQTEGLVYSRALSVGANVIGPPAGEYYIKVRGLVSQTIYFGLTGESKIPVEMLSATNDPFVNKKVGGLRIKKIVSRDVYSTITEERSYLYTKDGSNESSGLIMNYPQTYDDGKIGYNVNSNCTIVYDPTLNDNNPTHLSFTSYSSVPLRLNSGGSYVGYSCVTELLGVNGAGGKTTSWFSNASSDPDIKLSVAQFDFNRVPYSSMAWNRGLTDSVKVYKRENGGFECISSVKNYYSKPNSVSDQAHSAVGITYIPQWFEFKVVPGGTYYTCLFDLENGNYTYAWRPYKIFSGYTKHDSTVEESYYATGIVRKKIESTYSHPYNNKYLAVTETKTKSSNGDELREVTRYPYDYDVTTPGNSQATGVRTLQIANVVTQPIEKTAFIKKSNESQYKMMSSSFFELQPTTGWIKEIFSTKAALPTNFVQSSASGGSISKDPQYYESKGTFDYNAKGGVTGLQKHTGDIYAYIYDTRNENVIAEVIGAFPSQVYHNNFESTGVFGSAKTGLRYHNSGSFTVPFTPTDGAVYKMSYWYWESSQWKYSGIVPYNSSIANGTRLDDIRVFPETATMKTYTYISKVGITSETDHNGTSIFYEYDSANRLKAVKDNAGNLVKSHAYNYRNN